MRCETNGEFNSLRNLAPLSKQIVENYYSENCILATETTLPLTYINDLEISQRNC